MLDIKDLRCGYGKTEVLHGVSLSAAAGELLCVAGPNGCGKSTLLRAVARIIHYSGSISLCPEGAGRREIRSFSRKDLAKNIALMGQFSQDCFPYSVRETVAMGRYAHSRGLFKSLSGEDRALIAETMEKLGIWEVRDRMITELSGGQLQRVFLARTLVQNPLLILLDEPTNHLDMKQETRLLEYLARWAADSRRTVIAVIHDLNLARSFADSAAIIREGRVLAQGSPRTVFSGETLSAAYGMDVRAFMLGSLEKWRE